MIMRTEAFERSMKRTRGHVSTLNRNIMDFSRTLRRMASGIMLAAGIGGLGYMIRQQMATIDATAKLSDRLGISTEGLVALQQAAKIGGVETETLNKSMEIFSRRLGEVTMGVGEAKNALDKLGISSDDLVGKSMDEAIYIVADAINKLETQSEKAAVANYLFGRSGQQLLNMFSEGSRGLKDYREEVDRLSLSFSRVDAAKVEAANDAMGRMRDVFTGVFRTVTIELAPYIESFAEWFTEAATSGEGLGIKVTNAFESIVLSIAITIGKTELLIAKFNQLRHPLLGLEARKKALERYRAITGDTLAGKLLSTPPPPGSTVPGVMVSPIKYPGIFNKALAQEQEKLQIGLPVDQTKEIQAAFEAIRQRGEAKKSNFEKVRERLMALPRGEGGFGDVPAAEEAEEADKQIMSSSAKRMKSLISQVDEEMRLLGNLTEPRQHAKMMIDFEKAAMEEYGDATKEAESATEEFRDSLDKLGIAEKWNEVAHSMADSMASAFDSMAFESAKSGESMKAVARAVLREFMSVMFFQEAASTVTSTLTQAFGKKKTAPSKQTGGYIGMTGLYRLHAGETVLPASAGTNVEVNVINQSTTPLRADKGLPRVTAKGIVTDILLSDAMSNGPIVQAFDSSIRSR